MGFLPTVTSGLGNGPQETGWGGKSMPLMKSQVSTYHKNTN
jgi:hypothetical protein